MLQQLELFSSPTESPETLTIGSIFEQNESWADGDTSPEQLERLARILKGKRECSYWRIKPAYFYRILDTRIEGDKVVATCQIVENPLGVKASNPLDEDDEC